MHRPIGVTLLAAGAGLAALFELWRMFVFLGVVNFTFVGKAVSYPSAQWGQAFWALLLAAIWIWIAEGFWKLQGRSRLVNVKMNSLVVVGLKTCVRFAESESELLA